MSRPGPDARILTVRQPWAWAIVEADKIENRSPAWERVSYRGWVWIHAAAERDARLRGYIAVSEARDDNRHAEWCSKGLPPEVEEISARALRSALLTHHGAALWSIDVQGAVIGGGNLVDIHRCRGMGCCRPFGEGVYHWGPGGGPPAHLVFDGVRRLWPPIEARGRLGLWRPDPDLAAELGEAWAA